MTTRQALASLALLTAGVLLLFGGASAHGGRDPIDRQPTVVCTAVPTVTAEPDAPVYLSPKPPCTD